MSSVAAFIDHAESCVGTRYKHQGRLPGVGIDCVGVVVCAARAVGLPVRDIRGYERTPSALQLIAALREHCDEVTVAEPGDILVFAWDTEPQHVAVLVEPGYIVHAYAGARRCVKHGLDATWSARVTNVFRLRGLSHG